MNTIILIILTLLFLLLSILGIFLFNKFFMNGGIAGFFIFVIGIVGLFTLGGILIGNSGFVKETICTYTVGKSDEICVDNYNYDFSHQIITTSAKIGFGYFIISIILIVLFIRNVLYMLWHMGSCIPDRMY